MSMHRCVYTYIHICVYIYIYIYVYIHVYLYIKYYAAAAAAWIHWPYPPSGRALTRYVLLIAITHYIQSSITMHVTYNR